MPRKEPRSRRETPVPGDGPGDTATVVIGIDGSGPSRTAFGWGCAEARRLGGRAVVVFIGPAAGSIATGMCAAASLAAVGCLPPDGTARERAGDLGHEMLIEAVELRLTVVHAPGDPVAELLRIAGELHADLIVAGRSAAGPYRPTDSIGQRLAARRRQSVIVVVP